MAIEFNWIDQRDDVDDADAEVINNIARAIIDLINAGETKEDVANKKTTMLDGITDDTTYPTTNAVYGFVSAKVQDELRTYDAYLNEAFAKKEDVSNKITELSENSTDEQYPSAKATYEGIQNKTAWELVDSAEITKDVQEFTTTENGSRYKELFIRISIPTMNADKVSGFTKGRVFVYDQNGTVVAQENNTTYQDLGYTSYLTIHAKLFGNICIANRTIITQSGHGSYITASNGDTGSTGMGNGMTGGVKLTNDYLTKLRVLMYPLNERIFPAGTKYELWGVKA